MSIRPVSTAILALACALPGGCVSTAPLAPIPAPLPETLQWARPETGGAFLGLRTEENDSGSLDSLFFDPGARVVAVAENSPAAAAGFQVGDIVLAVDGRELADPAALDALVDRAGPGARIELRAQRGDTVFSVPAELAGSAPTGEEAEVLWRRDPARSRAGWATAPGGVLLASAAADSPFPRDGVPVGSLVVALDGKALLSDRELLRALDARAPGTAVEVRFRDRSTREGNAAPRWEPAERVATVRLVEQPVAVIGSGIFVLWHYEALPDGHQASLDLLDLWVLELFRYGRQDGERKYEILKLFGWPLIHWSTGVGMLE